MTTSSDQSVHQIVIEHPEAITVLEQYGIDYRCGNESTLAEVCSQRDLDLTLIRARESDRSEASESGDRSGSSRCS